jgi:hypothetical protein
MANKCVNTINGRPYMKSSLQFICLAAALALTGCGGSSEPRNARTLAKCYAEEFGVRPPAGVTHLQAKQVVVGDAGAAWLRFVVDTNAFAEAVAKRFTPCDYTTFTVRDGAGGNTPAWWRPTNNSTTTFYCCSHWRSTENYSEAVLAYDRADNVVYFHHGISF